MLDFLTTHKTFLLLITPKSKDAFRELFFARLKERIQYAYIQDITVKDDTLEFKAPLGRHYWNGWNLFNTVTKAHFRISIYNYIPKLDIKFNFLEIFITALLLSATSLVAFYHGLTGWGILILIAIWATYIGTRYLTVHRMEMLAEEIRHKINNPDIEFLDAYDYFLEDIEFAEIIFHKNPEQSAIG